MSLRSYLLLATALVVVAVVSVTLAVTLRDDSPTEPGESRPTATEAQPPTSEPEPLTGDHVADAACERLDSAVVTPQNEGKEPSVLDIINALNERRADVVEAADLAADSSIAGIRTAGSELASALGNTGANAGFDNAVAVAGFMSACTDAGWTR